MIKTFSRKSAPVARHSPLSISPSRSVSDGSNSKKLLQGRFKIQTGSIVETDDEMLSDGRNFCRDFFFIHLGESRIERTESKLTDKLAAGRTCAGNSLFPLRNSPNHFCVEKGLTAPLFLSLGVCPLVLCSLLQRLRFRYYD